MTKYHSYLRTVFVALSVGLATCFALGFARSVPQGRETIDGPSEDARMYRKIDHITFEHVPLKDALQWVADASGLKLGEQWAAADPEFPADKTQIDLHLKQVSFATILNEVLRSVSPGNTPGWTIKDGVILIESQDKLEAEQKKLLNQKAIVRVYDVQSILEKMRGPSDRILPENSSLQNASQGQSLFQNQQSSSIDPALDELKMLITDNVASDTWKDNGGDVGSIASVGGIFSIEQSPAAHRQIERFLRSLSDPR